jgi:glycosyltransferase involved in cell wall biosynthesis
MLCVPTLRGWNRYTVNLISELLPLGVEAVLFSDQPVHESHLARFSGGKWEVRISSPMNYFRWEQVWLPRECVSAGVDVLHSPFNFGLPFWSSCPRILTLHDAADQIYFQRRQRLGKRIRLNSLKMNLLLWIARTRAEQIITVSEHARQDLVEHLGISAEKISVTYEAADSGFGRPLADDERKRVRARYGLDAPYVFYVGGWEQRKNVSFLLTAFARARLAGVCLVLAGGTAGQMAELSALSTKLGVAGSVQLLGWVDEPDLPALYAEALCFAYPSEYEGFGLQICEAMAAGCPVLAARAASLPEILGNGGETFSLESTTELEVLLQSLAGSADVRAALQRKARIRIQEFSWQATAQKTLEVYRKAVNIK